MSEEKSIISFDISEDTLNVDIDSNKDGKKVVGLSLKIKEAIKEAIARGTPVKGGKVATFEFEGTKLVISIDSDRDGEPMLAMSIDLMEAFDEIKDQII